MMLKIGVNSQWLKWVMLCVETFHYSMLVNQDCVDQIQPSRGLCQGDPLSSYLFLLCAEGLSVLIKHEVDCQWRREGRV